MVKGYLKVGLNGIACHFFKLIFKIIYFSYDNYWHNKRMAHKRRRNLDLRRTNRNHQEVGMKLLVFYQFFFNTLVQNGALVKIAMVQIAQVILLFTGKFIYWSPNKTRE